MCHSLCPAQIRGRVLNVVYLTRKRRPRWVLPERRQRTDPLPILAPCRSGAGAVGPDSRILSYCCATVAVWLSARSALFLCLPTWTRKSLLPPTRRDDLQLLARGHRPQGIHHPGGPGRGSQFEDEYGAFTPGELADADQWATEATERASRSGTSTRRRSA